MVEKVRAVGLRDYLEDRGLHKTQRYTTKLTILSAEIQDASHDPVGLEGSALNVVVEPG